MKVFYFLIIALSIHVISTSFQTSIFSEINKEFIGKNLIISPMSIYQILSLTANGANSLTLKEMVKTLESDSIKELNQNNFDIIEIFKELETVEMANAVMTKVDPLDDFLEIAEQYLAPVEPLESADQVNDWCSEKTHGKIKKILETLSPEVRMILINAIYFKGEWSKKFLSSLTKKRIFYNFNDKDNEVEIDTMIQTEHFKYYKDSKIQAIELRYRKDSMSAIIILPNKDIDINNYIDELTSKDELNTIINKLQSTYIQLELPKFELDFSSSLKNSLLKLGMPLAFSDDADFSNLAKKENLKIDDVVHKTYLKVTEDGTEAAAVTMVIMAPNGSIDMDIEIPINVKVNRPFLFLLRNSNFPEDNNMFFMAKIEELK